VSNKKNPIDLLRPNMQVIVKNGFTRESLENELNKCYFQNYDVCNICTKNVQIEYVIEPNIFIEIDLMGYYGQETCTLASIPINLTINRCK
jgi:hypothetical protein